METSRIILKGGQDGNKKGLLWTPVCIIDGLKQNAKAIDTNEIKRVKGVRNRIVNLINNDGKTKNGPNSPKNKVSETG